MAIFTLSRFAGGIPILLDAGLQLKSIWEIYNIYSNDLGLISADFNINADLWNNTYNTGNIFEESKIISHVPWWMPFNAYSGWVITPTNITINSGDVILQQGNTYNWSFSPEAVIVQGGGTTSWAHYGGYIRLKEVRITKINSISNALQLSNQQYPNISDPGDLFPLQTKVRDGNGNILTDAQVSYTIYKEEPSELSSNGYNYIWTKDGFMTYSQTLSLNFPRFSGHTERLGKI